MGNLLSGNTRWEASRMMLPEHKEAIRQFYAEQDKVEKHGPLDEQEWQLIGEVVMDALHHTLKVRVTYWRDGHYYNLDGYIHRLDEINKKMQIEYGDEREWLPLDVIREVERF
ncbi:YolD-like family protein [Shouchella shacheensis]|uniref:YolD-like family protein n=1 Tax=Shouchella shacheensis TaxID=1649580 RepID=UPI00074005EC|nr:YolD-like family protein [Shouchella shacheensis]